jgi:hypothetical protein
MRTVPKQQQDSHFSSMFTCAAHGLSKGPAEIGLLRRQRCDVVADGRRRGRVVTRIASYGEGRAVNSEEWFGLIEKSFRC